MKMSIKMMTKTKKRGFTLIELLVVIAVIGMLSSIVLVSLKGVRDKAKASRVISDLTQIKKAIYLYWADTEMDPPHDHAWSDDCERAVLISGNFDPRPAGWNGPYIGSWPKTPWGTEYHWGLYPGLESHSIHVRNVPQNIAQLIDSQIDDGDPGTGDVLWNSVRGSLVYRKDFRQFPATEIHATSCRP